MKNSYLRNIRLLITTFFIIKTVTLRANELLDLILSGILERNIANEKPQHYFIPKALERLSKKSLSYMTMIRHTNTNMWDLI